MGEAIRDPTYYTGKVTDGPAPGRTQRDRTTGAAQDMAAEEGVPLVGYRTGRTAEAEVRKGIKIITPTPPPPRHTEDVGRRSERSGRR